ncbi:hypothetical protein KIW84_021732 [Lathyrus oleraceus]|uniref:Uncharacterized protein n=1 Tax=Pisum sativum TaxID=3888 RepID=A0A9D4YCG5_PEA|nr:hypothetical protein KIW84_021732 [Pisum sativum]
MDKRYRPYDPFILAQNARQVYYVPYPEMCRDMHGWCAAITTKPMGRIEIDNIEDEVPYQSDGMLPALPKMTKRGGKAKVLAPGKLQEQRNRIINKKHIVRTPGHKVVPAHTALLGTTPAQITLFVHDASSAPTPAQGTLFVQAASLMPTPAQAASSVQVASSMPTSASKKSSVQAASSMPTPAPTVVHVHATTSEKFSFMLTPTLSHQTMADPQSINLQIMASPSNLAEEEDVDADEDEVVGQENVTPLVPTIDENGKVIIKPSGTG